MYKRQDWDGVLPYFKKAENQENGANAFHGTGGPLSVSNQPVRLEIAEQWIRAALEAGLPANDDFNDGLQDGAGHFQCTMNRRRRVTTATAYLKPARNRPNLTIETKARVARILIEQGKAAGVAYVRSGVPRTARACGEVIVCGGAFNSPKLLQLSGLGPADLLCNLGIPLIRDLPGVGANLQDHFSVRCNYRCTKPITLNDIGNSFWRRVVAGAQYLLFRNGPLASTGIVAGGYVRSAPCMRPSRHTAHVLRLQLLRTRQQRRHPASILRFQRRRGADSPHLTGAVTNTVLRPDGATCIRI